LFLSHGGVVSSPDEQLDEFLERLLVEGEQALDIGDHQGVRERIDEMRRVAGDDEARARYLEGLLAWDVDGVEAAVALLKEALRLGPDDADIHHSLALAYEELGYEDAMVRHFLQTRILDARADREAGFTAPEALALIERVAEETLARLPAEFRERMQAVPVMLERRPSLPQVRGGLDPRACGLFEGTAHHVARQIEPHVDMPTRIVLYTSNLLASCDDDEELAEQVEITILHEIAHYFGFEEEEMEGLGLE
jgi:predicted Zn-dependent protease with MMP-like domain